MLRRSSRLNPLLTLPPAITSVRELFRIFEVTVIIHFTCCHGAAFEGIFAFICLSASLYF